MRSTVRAQAISPLHASRGGTLLGIMVGLTIGVVVAIAAALYITNTKPPIVDHARNGQSSPLGGSNQSGPITLPGKPGDVPVEKPKLDFYDILPKGGNAEAGASSTPVTTPATTSASAPVAAPATAASATERYYLQLGAFQDPVEADNLKARLALIGMESNVQRIDTPDKGALLRVRVGPYSDIREADTARAQLVQNGINSSLIRSKTTTVPSSQ